MFCVHCGTETRGVSTYCPKCGASLVPMIVERGAMHPRINVSGGTFLQGYHEVTTQDQNLPFALVDRLHRSFGKYEVDSNV